MTDDLARAQSVIDAAENGGYDQQFGIDPGYRALLIKATSDEPMTLADLAELARLNRPDLIDAAHSAGRFNLTEGDNQ